MTDTVRILAVLKDVIQCNNCGACCYYMKDGHLKPCKNLRIDGAGKSSCAIYDQPDRIGTEIDDGVYCNSILDVDIKYEGCPYNIIK